MNGQKDVLVGFQNYANELWHWRNGGNTLICVVFKMLVDESKRDNYRLEVISDLTGVWTFHWYAFFSPIYAYILRIISYTSVNFWYANYVRTDGSLLITLVWIIFHAKFLYLICTLSEWILYIVARENSVSYTIVVAARSIAVYTGSLAKKSVLACDAKKTKKRELESDQTIFWDMCLQTIFYVQKNKWNLSFDGKSRVPFLARVAHNNEVCLSKAMFSKNVL